MDKGYRLTIFSEDVIYVTKTPWEIPLLSQLFYVTLPYIMHLIISGPFSKFHWLLASRGILLLYFQSN